MTPRGLKILVVDDCEDAAISLAAVLRLHGYQVTVAHNGADGLAAIHETAPEVLLLDIGMPGLTGYDVAQRIKELNFPNRPYVIAVTGLDQPVNRVTAEQTGFDMYLVKPVDPEMLLNALRQIAAGTTPHA